MNLQEIIDQQLKEIRSAQFATSDQLSLGGLIDKLEDIPIRDGNEQRVVFDFEYSVPENFMSWRGIYAELALGFSFNEGPTLAEFIASAKRAVGETFQGYKGGDFMMTRDTPLWVANYGNAGNTAIVGVYDDGWQVVLMTAFRPS